MVIKYLHVFNNKTVLARECTQIFTLFLNGWISVTEFSLWK